MRRVFAVWILVSIASSLSLSAQDVLMGGVASPRSLAQVIFGATITIVDVARPANAAGSLTHALVRTLGGCSQTFRLKFIRPSGTNLNVYADRGPFGTVNFVPLTDVALSPPVTVQRGDLLGLTFLGPSGCILPRFNSSSREVLIRVNGDPAVGTNLTGISYEFGQTIDARATTSISVVGAIIPAAGAATGVGNSQFKTDVQLSNNSFDNEIGKLVYHKAQTPGTSSDPFLAFNVPARSTVLFSDVVGKMGLSGVGSIDLVQTVGDLPVASVRVYTDGGVNGTSGFTEEVFPPDLALREYDYVVLQSPADPVKFRMNVGIRTLAEGATIQINGGTPKSYPATYFEQVGLAAFLANGAATTDAFTSILVTAGRIFIYASTTDNTTNDSAIKFLTPSNNQ